MAAKAMSVPAWGLLLFLSTANCSPAARQQLDCAGSKCADGEVEEEASLLQFQKRVAAETAPSSEGGGEAWPWEHQSCRSKIGRTCTFFECPQSNGPVQCVAENPMLKSCQCMPGFCVDASGKCVSSLKTVIADVWPINKKQRTFPNGKPRIAVSVSGGGNRALSYGTGVLRGLTELGLMPKVEGLSSVSGGSWMSSLYMFVDRRPSLLLGTKTVPSELTMGYLEQKHSEILNAATSSFNYAIECLLGKGTPVSELWQKTVGKVFLEPFGLNSPVAYLAGSEADAERISANNPTLAEAEFNVPRPNRPKTFIINGALSAPIGYVSTPNNTVALQMSPDYIGSPFYPNSSKVMLEGTFLNWDCSALVGGGMLESFAFGGLVPKSKEAQNGGEAMPVGAPPVPFTLSDAMGISSWTYGLQLENTLLAFSNPSVRYWPITSPPEFPPTHPDKQMTTADGGNYDNAGLLALLQREAEKIVWISSSWQGLNESYPWDTHCLTKTASEPFDPVLAGVVDSVVDKFGFGNEVSDAGNYLQNNQVFNKDEIFPLSCQIWELKQQGKPAVVKFNTTLLKNTWWNIEGGSEVEIILIYLESATEFNDALPETTQAEIATGDKGKLASFPIYKTMFQNPPEAVGYTGPQTNLLAAFGEYAVVQNKALFESLFA